MAKRTRRPFGAMRELPSGRIQASYIGPDGQRHNAPQTFDTKRDASEWLAVKQADIARETWQRPEPPKKPSAVPTFESYSGTWLSMRKLRPSSRARYRVVLRDHLLPAFGSKRLDEITLADVQAWYAGFPEGRSGVRAFAYARLETIMRTAIEDLVIEGPTPCRIRGGGAYEGDTDVRIALPGEIEAIAAAMRPRWSAMVLIAAWCQLRFGEIAGLRRRDIDVERGVVRVRRTVQWLEGEAVVGPPKSRAGKRDVVIPPHVLPAVEAHLDEHVAPGADAMVFTTPRGRLLYRQTISDEYRRAREAAGRPDLRFHDLRHTGATIAAQAGATTAELMARLGHSSPRMAMRYQHAVFERDTAIAAALSDFAEAGANVVPLRRARKAKAAGMERRLAEAEAELAELRAQLGRGRQGQG